MHELLWTRDSLFEEGPDAAVAYCRCGWMWDEDEPTPANVQRRGFLFHLIEGPGRDAGNDLHLPVSRDVAEAMRRADEWFDQVTKTLQAFHGSWRHRIPPGGG